MAEIIKHEGVVTAIVSRDKEQDFFGIADVQILQQACCEGCSIKSNCSVSGGKVKNIEAKMVEDFQVGDKVEVVITQGLAWKALLLAYILPFLVLILAIVGVDFLMSNEMIVGLVGICAIAVYFIVLHFFKDKLQTSFSIVAHKI